jgi:hypothetical protein
MNKLKIIFLTVVTLFAALACEKDIDNLDKIGNVNAPKILSVTYDIKQDNSGRVTIMPQAEGVTGYRVKFGDVADETPTEFALNEKIMHTYPEGEFKVEITGIGLTGLTAAFEADLMVSFKAPENLTVSISPDNVNPRLINVSATADFATVMDIYFGEVDNEEPVSVLPGEEASNLYEEPGDYVIRVVARSGGEATTEYTETINIAEASDPVLLPINFESFTVNYAFSDFEGTESSVIDNPDASGINTSGRVAQTIKGDGALTYAGSILTLGETIDFSTNKLFKMKVWSPKVGAIVKLKVENLDNGEIGYEVDATTSVSGEWEELEFNFAGIDENNTYQKVIVFFDFDVAGDGSTYFWDDVRLTSSGIAGGIVGTWKVASEAGAIGVGPGQGDISWWSIDEQGVIDRACYFDDQYVFGADGSFMNVLGAETWVEGWQGNDPEGCAAPVFPHDGSTAATYVYDEAAGNITLTGVGAYLGIAKAFNMGELTSPGDAPESITYIVEFSEGGTRMTVDIQISDEGWWRYILVKEGGGGGGSTPWDGTWQIAPEAGSLGVGPGQGDISWWSIDDAGVAQRACYFDDTYVFGADGSFMNVLGADTWVEVWQGNDPEGCAAPVFPHDGSNPATFTWDEGAGTLTLNGVGAYLGLAKVINGAELASPGEAPESVTYIVEFQEDNTVAIVDIEIANGGWWRYKLIKN